MPAYHQYPAHKRHPGRDSRRMPQRTKTVAFRTFTRAEYEMMKPFLDPKRHYIIVD